MKKTLMAGTALVAGSMVLAAAPVTAAEKIKLSLGGYMEQWFGYSDNDTDFETIDGGKTNSVDQKSDSEIYIKGNTTLDNGLKFGVKWEIEGSGDQNSAGSTSTSTASHTGRLDEAMLFVSGSFGRVNIGTEDTASELMGYGAPAVGPLGVNKTDLSGDWVRKPSSDGSLNTHNMDLGMSDKNNVSYFSPRISGFQVGGSYHPEINENSDRQKLEANTAHQGFSTGVNYVKKHGDVSVAVYGAYAGKEASDAAGQMSGSPYGYGFGASVGWKNWTFGGSYISEDETSTKTNWNAGVRYKMGMNAFSVALQESETDVTNQSDDDKTGIVTFGYERTLGPGVKWGSSVGYVDIDGGASDTGTDDNKGFAAVTGIRLDF